MGEYWGSLHRGLSVTLNLVELHKLPTTFLNTLHNNLTQWISKWIDMCWIVFSAKTGILKHNNGHHLEISPHLTFTTPLATTILDKWAVLPIWPMLM